MEAVRVLSKISLAFYTFQTDIKLSQDFLSPGVMCEHSIFLHFLFILCFPFNFTLYLWTEIFSQLLTWLRFFIHRISHYNATVTFIGFSNHKTNFRSKLMYKGSRSSMIAYIQRSVSSLLTGLLCKFVLISQNSDIVCLI